MDRLDLELYAERLARHAERTADDLADARLREAWWELEQTARPQLTAADVAVVATAGPPRCVCAWPWPPCSMATCSVGLIATSPAKAKLKARKQAISF